MPFKKRGTFLLTDPTIDLGRESFERGPEKRALLSTLFILGVTYFRKRSHALALSELHSDIWKEINSVVDTFYRQVKLPTDRIISKLLGRHGDSDSLRYVSFSNNRQHESWTVESMPGKSFHEGAA
ncbi:hypothetical protein CEXT_678501 [Caerostris extrusa]|uniref:DUF4158 domain-containing protein n=1 Tax=Caerostris extrusa TaxID=172846 RepID=A0AAV4UMM5_CAEEX|nr:hypothetical protein CEXT_678501 [Caerostris extrusa]